MRRTLSAKSVRWTQPESCRLQHLVAGERRRIRQIVRLQLRHLARAVAAVGNGRYVRIMVRTQADEIHRLRKRLAALNDEVQRKIDGLVISVLAEDTERTFSEHDVCQALRAVDFELAAKDAYPLLTRLAREQRIQSEGPKYRGIGPGVLKRQLRETPGPKAKGKS